MSESVSFEELETFHREHLEKFAKHTVFLSGGTREDAEEIYAESRLRALRHFVDFRFVDNPWKVYWSWRCRIIINVWRDELRRRRDHLVVSMGSYFSDKVPSDSRIDIDTDELDLPDPNVDIEGYVIAEEERSLQWKLIVSLFDKYPVYFRCIILYYYCDLSCKDIAEILHCPVVTVRTRLHRGRNVLRQKLAGNTIFI